MKRRAPMKRTAWLRSTPAAAAEQRVNREQRLSSRAAVAMKNIVPRAAVMVSATTSCAPIAKADPIRSEAYRRAVAQLPCAICGIYGYSQAAHANTGKGIGMKACDLTLFPACADRPGVRGCHSKLDQGALFSKLVRRELEPVWAADTQRRVRELGLWPQSMDEGA